MTWTFPRRFAASLGSLALLAGLAPVTACKPGKNAAGVIAQNPSAADATGQAKCKVKQSQNKPLIIEWPGADRAALEGRAARGVVPVRYNGCEMEVLTDCTVAALQYTYLGLTPRTESVRIRDFDELYANLPIGAAKLEAKLEKSGQLNVDMVIAGRLEAPAKDRYNEYDLEGLEAKCKTATHVITGITVGAFQFTSGAGAEIGGGAEVSGVAGAGAKSTSEKEFISQGGKVETCSESQPGSTEAPPLCREMLRIEVVEIERTQSATPVSGSGSSNSGSLGLRDRPADDEPAVTGWTPQLERKRKMWTGVTYVGVAGFALGGVATIVGLLMNSRAESGLADVGVDGNSSTVATTGSDRTKAIRQAQIGKPLLITGYITLAAGGIMATIALPVAQKLKKQKDALTAHITPMLTAGGGGANLRVKF
jgi:hypothetical protein